MEITMHMSKIQIILCVTFLSLWGVCGKPMPFDCATPIILGPILQQMRSVQGPVKIGKTAELWNDSAKWPSLTYVFEISECPLPDMKKRYDRIVQIKYDRMLGKSYHFNLVTEKKEKVNSVKKDGPPYELTTYYYEGNKTICQSKQIDDCKGLSDVDVLAGRDILEKQGNIDFKVTELVWEKEYSHVFRLHVKDGLVMKLVHLEPSGVVHEYHQSIKDKVDGIRFENAEYTKLSKESLLNIYKGECLWLRLPTGRHEAEIRLRPVCDLLPKSQRRFWGMLLMPDKPLTVDFEFCDQNVRHLYISSHRGKDLFGRDADNRIMYYIMNVSEAQDGKYCLLDAAFYDKWSNIVLRAHFYENLGLKEYSKGKRGVCADMMQWKENGANHKCFTAAQQKKDLEETLKSLGIDPSRK